MIRFACASLACAALLGACSDSVSPAAQRQSTAKALGLYSTELIDDQRAQALDALARDARRREVRFYNVANPGFLFASTRVPQEEIDRGLWPAEDLFQLGAQLFNQRFRRENGFGGKDTPGLSRFERGKRGGPEAYQCADCHRLGGLAGGGDASDNAYLDGDGEHQESALERNPISLAGAGYVEMLAGEMTAELARARDGMLAAAADSGAPVRGALLAKGVSFGFLTARPDGSIDARELAGVDADLTIKPFGWKGHTAHLRDMIENELAIHHGMQSDWLVANAGAERLGPFGAPDPDGDGVVGEISEGQVTALTLFVAMQEVPAIEPPVTVKSPVQGALNVLPMYAEGVSTFEDIGCGTCHVPSLPLESPVYVLPHRAGGPELRVDLAQHGAEPRLHKTATGAYRLWLFSDLKRHDMGSELADSRGEHGVGASSFLTPPLWGIVRSRPYLHDGHSPTLEAAILHHGGEAQAARDAYFALDDKHRAPVRVYLTALTRARRFLVP